MIINIITEQNLHESKLKFSRPLIILNDLLFVLKSY